MGTLGIISLIVGAIAAIAGTAVSASSIHKTNETNKQIAAMQNQWNVEQWQRENAYNDPSQQVQRLAAAGINPSLAVGQSGLVDAGNAQQVHPAAGATMQPFQMDGSALSAPINQAAMLDSQINANDAYARKENAEAAKTEQSLPEFLKQMEAKTNEINKSVESINQQIEESKSKIMLMDSQQQLNFAEKSHYRFIENLESKEYGLKLKQFKEQVRLNNSTISHINSQIGLNASLSEYYTALKDLNRRSLLEMEKTFNYRFLGIQNNAWSSSHITQQEKIKAALLGLDLEKGTWLSQTSPWNPSNRNGLNDFLSMGINTFRYASEPINLFVPLK